MSIYSFKRYIPQDCYGEDMLKRVNSDGAVQTFKRNFPGSSFEVVDPIHSFSTQCHYWFFHTDGKKQENLWFLIDNDRMTFGSAKSMCFDNPGKEAIYIDRSSRTPLTQEYCN